MTVATETRRIDGYQPLPMSVGQQVRDLRRAKGFSTAALADVIGKSTGYVNNIENERTDVTVTALAQISHALGVHISWFFQGADLPHPDEAGLVVRHDNRRQLQLGGAGIVEELLSPGLLGDLQMVLSTFAPGAATGEEPTRTEAEMAGVVLSGRLQVSIDERTFQLEEGDSFSVPKGAARRCVNRSQENSVTLWVNTPPVY